MLEGARFIAATDLKNMLRRRETILWVFVMPIVFFYFIGTITGGFGRPRSDRPDPLVMVVPSGGGMLVDEIERKLRGQNFSVERTADATRAANAIRALTIAPGRSGTQFSEAVTAGERQQLIYRTRSEGATAEYERFRVSRAVYGVLADLVVLSSEGRPVDQDAFRSLEAEARLVTLKVESAGHRDHVPTGFEQTVPGTLVMFTMLVSLTSGAILLVVERRLGLLRRLAAAPISPGAIVLGKWVARLSLAIVQIVFAMITGTVLFRMNWGSALPMVLLLLILWASFNASLALLLGSVARTEGQMAGIGVIASMALAALGGCWWPIEIAPQWMQSLALALPTGWAMDAMHRLVSFGDPPRAVVPHVAALAAGTVLAGWLGTKVFRYE